MRLIVFVLNNSGDLSERMGSKDMALADSDTAAWNHAELRHVLSKKLHEHVASFYNIH